MPVNADNDQRPMLANSNVKLNTPRKELSTAWRKTLNNSNVPLRPQCDEALTSRRGLKRCEDTSTQPTNYEPERQHVNIRAAIKLYEEGKIDGIQSITIINGEVLPAGAEICL
ncbi:hypothetical protein V498_00874 [Pseudogymnoascus sp. VKM F-4517 (FW-2822)]|nr:hypothetical protein V498_00874 [Pseudogymnoascus sp. VKM F-4517 (FW-2822)]